MRVAKAEGYSSVSEMLEVKGHELLQLINVGNVSTSPKKETTLGKVC